MRRALAKLARAAVDLLEPVERRQSPENPATSLSNPAEWLMEAFGAAPSAAGVSVNETTAMNIAAWYQCVAIRSKALGVSPLLTYEREEGGRRRADDLRIYHLLHERPNPEMTAFLFHETMGISLASWGNAYAEIEWRRNGQPEALWWLPPADCEVQRTGSRPQSSLRPNTKYVKVLVPPGVEGAVGVPVLNGYAYLPPGKYVHVAGPTVNGLTGMRPAIKAKETLGHSDVMGQFGSTFFSRGAKSATLIMPKEGVQMQARARQRLQENLAERLGGLSNQHRLLVLEAGLEAKVIGVPPEAAQFLESRMFLGEEIARFHDIPPYRLGLDKSGQSYGSIEAKQLDLATGTHLPDLTRFEQVYSWELMPDRDLPLERRGRWYAEFLFDALLRADSKTRAEVERIYVTSGIRTFNEIRAQNNWPRLALPEADIPWVQINTAPISTGGGESSEPAPRAEKRAERRKNLVQYRQRITQAHRPGFQRFLERLVAREVGGLHRLATRIFSQPDPLLRLRDELEAFYEPYPELIVRDLAPLAFALAGVLAEAIGIELDIDATVTPEVEKMAADYARVAAERHIIESKARIVHEAEAAEDLERALDAIRALLDRWTGSRAEVDATYEAARAAGALSLSLYENAGVQALVWSGGDCPLCASLNGTIVATSQPFVPAGGTVNAEGAAALTVQTPIRHPPLHRKGPCDCVLLAM